MSRNKKLILYGAILLVGLLVFILEIFVFQKPDGILGLIICIASVLMVLGSIIIAEKSANIEGGAGRITISDGAIKNLDLEMGLGQLNLTSALTGDCNLDSGVGEMNVTLLGSKDDYELDIEKGIGNITVDGKNVTDFGSSGDGANEVDIHGGVGAINVRFNNE